MYTPNPRNRLDALLPKTMHLNTRSIVFAAFTYNEPRSEDVYSRDEYSRDSRRWGNYSYDFDEIIQCEFLEFFTNLHTLAFRGMSLPRETYEVISRLKNLRTLTIVNGALPACEQDDRNLLSGLQLDALHLGGNCWRGSSLSFVIPQQLTLLPTIRVLKTDWNTETALFFGRAIWGVDEVTAQSSIRVLSTWNVRPRMVLDLEHVELTTRTRKEWDNSSDYLTQDLPLWSIHLLTFLRSCSHTLKRLVIDGYMSDFGPDVSLELPQLSSYKGPLDLLTAFVAPSLEDMELTDGEVAEDINIPRIIDHLRCVPNPLRVTKLHIIVESINLELLDTIRDRLKRLEELRIQVLKRDSILELVPGMGKSHLSHLSRLRVLHVYDVHARYIMNGPVDKYWVMLPADIRYTRRIQEHVVLEVWKDFTPSLREVRFSLLIFKRENEQARWSFDTTKPFYRRYSES
ncbi:hypothetical protein VNI00_010477 [Paramarasmius palmivorus]|uniref:F-box domain-containing protein n=1 Tax=Paramarasmius palmivorus TaxID=297713 RepID=A0AAW0CKT3_9AGAR